MGWWHNIPYMRWCIWMIDWCGCGGGLRLKRGSQLWCGVQREKEEWECLCACFFHASSAGACICDLVLEFYFVLSLLLSYYISLSFRCFCSNMCAEKRETSLVMPLQEDHIRSPKLPLDVLSCQRRVVIIQHLQYEICYPFDRSSLRTPGNWIPTQHQPCW